jgi:integrase
VTIDGKDLYLGNHGTGRSRAEYDRLIAEWMANGRRLPVVNQGLTLVELIALHWRHCETFYVKDGRPTSEQAVIRLAMRPLKELYGHTSAANFGPLALRTLRERYIADKLARNVVNAYVNRVRRMFRWAVGQELLPPSVAQALAAVEGLQRGRSTARETEPIGPVGQDVIDVTLPYLSPVIRDMIALQKLTGTRPSEICEVRPCDVDRSGKVWKYRPESHKTEHHGRQRVIFIGPQAQRIFAPYLLRPAGAYCFTPAESEEKRLAEIHARRKTPIRHGNRPKRKRIRKLGERFRRCASSSSQPGNAWCCCPA